MRLVLLASLLAFATPAAAQISAGPVGPFAVVDDNGKLVGGLVNNDGPREVVVSLTTPYGAAAREISDYTTQAAFFTPGGNVSFLFTTTNCTGPASPYAAWLSMVIDGGWGVAVGGNQTLYAATGPETVTTVGSFIGSDGSCQLTSNTSNYTPLTAVGDLAAEFTPPFHVVTVASQTATVPIHFGWLLGGVLLGLGMKVLRNRPTP